ncbi:MAG: hypothetical protein ACREF8_07155 [Chthoniobacterales bacterium]
MTANKQAVDAVIEPVASERIVKFGVTGGKWKANHEKEAQGEPGQESGGEICPSNRQAKYGGGETSRNYPALVSIGDDSRRVLALRQIEHATSKV